MLRAGLLRVMAVTAALVVTAAATAPAGAQEPVAVEDTATDPAAEAAAPAEADPPVRPPPRYALSLMVAPAGSNTLQRQPVVARRLNSAGAVLDSALLGRTVEAEGGYQVTGSALLSLGSTWAVRLGMGLGSTRLRSRYEGEDEEDETYLTALERLAATESTDLTVLEVEGALRMRLPSRRRAQPYLELGASAIHWSAGGPASGAPQLGEGVRRLGGLAAAGVLIPFDERWAAGLEASVRAFRSPVDAAPVGTEGPASSTVAVRFRSPQADGFADDAHELVSAFRLQLGVSLGLGGPVGTPDRGEPDAPTSPPGR